MSTQYPNSIDSNSTLPKVIDNISPIIAKDVNQLQEAIIAVQAELGTNPSGTESTVKDRLDDVFATLFATNVNITDLDGYYVSTDVEGALAEIGVQFDLIGGGSGTLAASLVSIADPDGYYVSDNVEGALEEIGVQLDEELGQIGVAEDGTYTDGLFVDFTKDTLIGTAVDRFNEILGELAPPPAPPLGDQSFASSLGVEGNVSFGTSNAIALYSNVSTEGGGAALDINGTFTTTGGPALRKGIYNDSTTHSGTLADSVAADTQVPNPSFPADAFGDGYDGYLGLVVNGLLVHSVDLTSFGAGSSLNGNGSGFTSISAGTPIQFSNGTPLELFNYRTADWVIDPSDQRNGWNHAQVLHDNNPTFSRTTNFFEWVVDDDVTATSYSAEVLDALSMGGSNFISGVEYHTSGSAQYDVTISNIHRNTYSTSASAVAHPVTTNATVASTALGAIAAESDTEIIFNQAVTVAADTANRILDGSLVVSSSDDRTIDANEATSPGAAAITGILFDSNSDTSTATNEDLSGEDYRVPSNRGLSDTSGFTAGGAGLWDSTISLASATAGYSDGLLVHGGQIFYPSDSSVANSGDFASITNGPAGNVDYSGETGAKVYWRYCHFVSATSNFTLRLNANGTVVDAGTVTGSTDEFSVEFLLPSQTSDTNPPTPPGSIEFKDANQSFTNEASIGCYAATYGSNVGDTSDSDWGISFGGRSTSGSGNAVIIRITAGDGWTGDISNIQLVAA